MTESKSFLIICCSIMKPLLVILLLAGVSTAQTQVGCFPLAVTQASVTSWCQILDNSPASPVLASWDTGLFIMPGDIVAHTIHLQYDPWYSPMSVSLTIEIDTFTQALVFQPILVTPDPSSYTQDIPIGSITIHAGDRMRLTWFADAGHTCNGIDNCGLHMAVSFN